MIETVDIARGLAREQALLAQTARAPEDVHIWFWQSDRALVGPRKLQSKPGYEATAAASAAHGWPLHVRTTGGDLTPQGPGIVNVTLVYALPEGHAPNIAASYDLLCRPMEVTLGAGASRGWNPGAFCDGAYNVQLNGAKFAGTAQRYKKCPGSTRMAVMSHALMLLEPPSEDAISAINRVLTGLKEPREIIAARHTALPADIDPEDFIQRLDRAYRNALDR